MRLLKSRLGSVGISCSEHQLAAFRKYHDLLLDWSKRTNLVSKADLSNVEGRHFFESIAVLSAIEIEPGAKILDVGSGAGFPSVPISLLRPDVDFLLVESKRMKVLFLRNLISCLGLTNVSVFGGRCEELAGKHGYQKYFDCVFSRAVGKLEVVYGWVQNMMKPGGVFVAWKGGDVAVEINSYISKYENKRVDLLKMDERLVSRNKNRSLVIIK